MHVCVYCAKPEWYLFNFNKYTTCMYLFDPVLGTQKSTEYSTNEKHNSLQFGNDFRVLCTFQRQHFTNIYSDVNACPASESE